MRFLSRHLSSIALAATLLSPVMATGCAVRARVYDPYYTDYHVWNRGEAGYYARWEGETHRTHVEFNSRPAAEQKEYFTWRHGPK